MGLTEDRMAEALERIADALEWFKQDKMATDEAWKKSAEEARVKREGEEAARAQLQALGINPDAALDFPITPKTMEVASALLEEMAKHTLPPEQQRELGL